MSQLLNLSNKLLSHTKKHLSRYDIIKKNLNIFMFLTIIFQSNDLKNKSHFSKFGVLEIF